MFCPKCGIQLSSVAIFCKKCGYTIQDRRKLKETVEIKKSKKNLKIILSLSLGGALLFFIIGIIGYISSISQTRQDVPSYTEREISSQREESKRVTLKEGNLDISPQIPEIIIPAYWKLACGGITETGLIHWRIKSNYSYSVNLRITSEIVGWSNQAIKQVRIQPNEVLELDQTPIYKENVMRNNKLTSATLSLKVEHLDSNREIFQETKSIQIAARGDIGLYPLGDERNKWIAAWVTLTDPKVLDVLKLAKEDRWHGRISMCGYQQKDPAHVKRQMRGIFFALEKKGISYASITGSWVGQRVQLPRESLRQKTANCIDGAVLYASLFEAIGLEPVIVLVRRHAFVGVRTSPGSRQCYYLETTFTGIDGNKDVVGLYRRAKKWIYSNGDDAFDRAIQAGGDNFRRYNKWQIIDIQECRRLGITPMQ